MDDPILYVTFPGYKHSHACTTKKYLVFLKRSVILSNLYTFDASYIELIITEFYEWYPLMNKTV